MPTKRSNKTHRSTSDPDARISFKPGKSYRLNYTSQVSVDSSNHVITSIHASSSDKKDCQSLLEVMLQAKANLKGGGIEIKEILADTNYSSMDALKAVYKLGMEAYIPNPGQYKVTRPGFTFEKEHDRYVCGKGIYLPFTHYTVDRIGYKTKIYSSKISDCKNCPLLATCGKTGRRKTIEDPVDRHLFDEMHTRMQSRKGKKMKKLRSSTVEPVLGSLINSNGMKRVNTKGLKQANKCMMLAAISYNLKKLLNFRRKVVLANAAYLPRYEKSDSVNGSVMIKCCLLDTICRSRFALN